MNSARRILLNKLLTGLMAAALCAIGENPAAGKTPSPKRVSSPREAFEIAVEAYIFGYPLVTMSVTGRLMTNVREPEGMRAPMGQFARLRTFPAVSDHTLTVPNLDMLYTGVWLDVSREPWVLSLPDAKGRYCLFSLIDGWSTVFAVPGKRATDAGPQQYAVTGPGWKGKLPAGLKQCKSSTGMVWVLGRIYCAGTPEDYTAAHALQDQCQAVPLSLYGKPYTPAPGEVDPAVNLRATVSERVNSLTIAGYFNLLAMLMKENPPVASDAPLIKRMARLGIVPGQPFDIGQLDSGAIQVLQDVPGAALTRITGSFKETGKGHDWKFQNGWRWTLKTGTYGTDYTQRALIAGIGRGATLPEDAVFATSRVDDAGQPYSGNFRYAMHFPPGKAPSAKGFWSLTLYGGDYFLVSNPLCRYAITARDPLKFNPDGSLDLCFQQHPPGAERDANWLPAPEGKFMLMLRVYRPNDSLLDGSWKIPPVKRAD
jgi:hypothetical protein